jgi:hypothetical protein
LLQTSGFKLSGARLPDGEAKLRILRAVDRAGECIPLRAVLRFLHLSPSRFHAWRGRQFACLLDDRSSCPRTAPHRLTRAEVHAIRDMVSFAKTLSGGAGVVLERIEGCGRVTIARTRPC